MLHAHVVTNTPMDTLRTHLSDLTLSTGMSSTVTATVKVVLDAPLQVSASSITKWEEASHESHVSSVTLQEFAVA